MKPDLQNADLAIRRQSFIREQIARARKNYSCYRESALRTWSSATFWILFIGILATGNVQAELVWLGIFATFWGALDVGFHWWRQESAYTVGFGTLKVLGGLGVLSGAFSLATRSFPGLGIALLFSGGFVIFFSLLVRELKVGVMLNQLVGFHSRRSLLSLSFNTHRLMDALRNDWNYAKVHSQLFVLERLELFSIKFQSAQNTAQQEWLKRSARLVKTPGKLHTYP